MSSKYAAIRQFRRIALGVLCLLVTALGYAQKRETFYTQNGKLFDANGKEFVVKGVNNPHIWFKDMSYAALDEIAAYGANSVRIVWTSKGDPNELRKIIERVVELKMIAMPELHDATGKDGIEDLLAVTKYWVRDDVKAILNEFKPYVLLNIANEWMATSDSRNWYDGYLQSIDIIRKGGLNHCLVVDAAGWGQNLEPVKAFADSLVKHDPYHNLLFSVHMYGSWNSTDKISRELSYCVQNKIPLMVGEFGYHYNNGENNLGCKADADFIMMTCNELGIGYMPWSWTGNNADNKWLDMVYFSNPTKLTEWGRLVLKGKHGIKKTAKRCSLFK
jgi:mannan endo-1,4-beta-mannosidase